MPESKGKYLIVWDATSHGTVANYFNYTGITIDFFKEELNIAYGKSSKECAGDELRKKLVAAARVGKNFIINVDKLLPNFNDEYCFAPDHFKSDVVFNYEEWHKKENYMKIVREDENCDMLMTQGNYVMMDTFTITILARYVNDENCAQLLQNIPHSD